MAPLPLEASLSEHDAVPPPLLPAQVHDHGPLPLTFEAVPTLQRFAVGAVLTAARSRCRTRHLSQAGPSRSPWSRDRCPATP